LKITREILKSGESVNGSFSHRQIALLGEDRNISGWYGRLIGKEVLPSAIAEFVELKDAHLSRGRPPRRRISEDVLTRIDERLTRIENILICNNPKV